MDKLREKLYKEMESWVSDLVTDSDLPKRELLSAYAYEYCIKDEIIDFFDGCDDEMIIIMTYFKKTTHWNIYTENIWNVTQRIYKMSLLILCVLIRDIMNL